MEIDGRVDELQRQRQRQRDASQDAFANQPATKRLRTSLPPEHDLMSDGDSHRPGLPNGCIPASATPALPNCIGLLHLPFACLIRIVSHVTSVDRQSPPLHSRFSPHMVLLIRALPLRLVCKQMRHIVDAHVAHFDFTGIKDQEAIACALSRALPRFTSLSALTITPQSTDRAFHKNWKDYFVSAPRHIRALHVMDSSRLSSVPAVLAAGCGAALQDVRVVTSSPTASNSFLSEIAEHCPNVRSVDVKLDGVDSRVLAGFQSLQALRVLFRDQGVSPTEMQMLTWALARCAPSLHCVELRVHNHDATTPATAPHPQTLGDGLALLPQIPRLRKLSLFSMTGWHAALPGWVCASRYLEEVQLEWCDDVTDMDIEELTRLMGARLHAFRVWNCASLTDNALRSLLQHLDPATQVDIRFERGQFSATAVAALGRRASWESWGRGRTAVCGLGSDIPIGYDQEL